MEQTQRELPSNLKLIAGVGDPTGKQLCIMSAVAWIAGEEHGDAPQCACPVLRRLSIQLNDGTWWDDGDERTGALLPLAKRLVGSRASRAIERERARVAAHRAVTVFAPMALRSAAAALEERFAAHAAKLRGHADTLSAFPLERFPAAAAAAVAGASAAARYSDAAARYSAARYSDAAATTAGDAAADAASAAARCAHAAATTAWYADDDAAHVASAAARCADEAADAARYADDDAARAGKRAARDALQQLVVDLLQIREAVEGR